MKIGYQCIVDYRYNYLCNDYRCVEKLTTLDSD